jgi:hypothetical protein
MKKVIALAVSCVLAASMCIGAFANEATQGRSVTEQGEAAYMTMDGQTVIGEMQINVTRNAAEDLDADMIAQIESAAGSRAVCQEVLQVVSSIEKGAAAAAADGSETTEAEEEKTTAVADEDAEREVVYVLHSLMLDTDLQEPDDVTMTVWFYDAINDLWTTSESLYEYDHKNGTLELLLQPGYTKAAIVTVQHKGVTGYLRTVQNKLLKLM